MKIIGANLISQLQQVKDFRIVKRAQMEDELSGGDGQGGGEKETPHKAGSSLVCSSVFN